MKGVKNKKYPEHCAEYFNTLADDLSLIQKIKKWQKSAKEYIRLAGTLFNVGMKDLERRKAALEMFDKTTKDARNAPKIGSRTVEYMMKMQSQKIADRKMGLQLRKANNYGEIPEYNRIPDGK